MRLQAAKRLQPRVYPGSRVVWWLHELSAYIDQLQSLMGDSLLKESKTSDGFSWLMGDGFSPPNIGHYSWGLRLRPAYAKPSNIRMLIHASTDQAGI